METHLCQSKQQPTVTELWNENEDDMFDFNRRESNVSLSRYRSCPHLADDAQIENQSFETTADDMSRLTAKLIINKTSPSIKRKFMLERSPCPGSSTPTPPSTPRSRRSVLSVKESPSTPKRGLSPASTPKLLHRRFQQRRSLSRDSSTESRAGSRQSELYDGKLYTPSQLSEDNVLKHDNLSKDEKTCDENNENEDLLNKQPESKLMKNDNYLRHYEDETQEKCERWLKTLNLSKPSRLKSRSHIQLPPI